jgi:hypothetical protein
MDVYRLHLGLILIAAVLRMRQRRSGQRLMALVVVATFALLGFGTGKWVAISSDLSFSSFAYGYAGDAPTAVDLCRIRSLRDSQACQCVVTNGNSAAGSSSAPCLFQVLQVYRSVMIERQWLWEMLPWLASAPCSGEYAIIGCQDRLNRSSGGFDNRRLPQALALASFTLVGVIVATVTYLWARAPTGSYWDAEKPEGS